MPKKKDYKKEVDDAMKVLRSDPAMQKMIAIIALDIKLNKDSEDVIAQVETLYLFGYLAGKGLDMDELSESLKKELGKRYVN